MLRAGGAPRPFDGAGGLEALEWHEQPLPAVEHGRPPGEVVLTLTIAAFDDHIDATLRDNAERFDDNPADAQLPPELAESGRGLTLAHLSVDSLTHHFDNGNVWTMSRRFTRSHS